MRYLFVSNLADVFKLLPILAHDRRQDKSERLRIIDRCKSGTTREQQEIHIGENIGDLGGLTIAHRAWLLSTGGVEPEPIDGLTGAQRFFLGWAQVWQDLSRPEQLRQRLATDPHAPDEIRCNQVARNVDAFHEAFGTTPGDGMWLDPEERVRIW